MMKQLAIAILFLTVSAMHAKTPISVALGRRLGREYKVDADKEMIREEDGSELYEYEPEKEIPPFSKYYVSITPKTNKIAQIWGVAEYKMEHEATKARDKLLSALEKKYGSRSAGDRTAQLAEMFGGYAISQGNRYILVLVRPAENGYRLILRYIDKRLKQQAKQERIELERSKGREGENIGESPL